MRPPRPWPSWRRAMSALIASGSSSSPAGRPSTMQVRPGPCDSPAVVRRRDMRRGVYEGVRPLRPTCRAGLVAARHDLRDDALGERVAIPGDVGAGLAGDRVVQQRAAGPGLAVTRVDAGPGVRHVALGDLVDLKLVAARMAITGRDVEERGVARVQTDDLAVARRGTAGAVAADGHVAEDHEDCGVLVVLDAHEERDGRAERVEGTQARDVLARVGVALTAVGHVEAPAGRDPGRGGRGVRHAGRVR